MTLPTLAECKKFLVALLGVLAEAVNIGLVDGTAAHWIGIVISLAVAGGVYVANNTTPLFKKNKTNGLND